MFLILTATDCSPIQNSEFTNLPLSGFITVTQLIKRFTSFTQLKVGKRKRKPCFGLSTAIFRSTDCFHLSWCVNYVMKSENFVTNFWSMLFNFALFRFFNYDKFKTYQMKSNYRINKTNVLFPLRGNRKCRGNIIPLPVESLYMFLCWQHH